MHTDATCNVKGDICCHPRVKRVKMVTVNKKFHGYARKKQIMGLTQPTLVDDAIFWKGHSGYEIPSLWNFRE